MNIHLLLWRKPIQQGWRWSNHANICLISLNEIVSSWCRNISLFSYWSSRLSLGNRSFLASSICLYGVFSLCCYCLAAGSLNVHRRYVVATPCNGSLCPGFVSLTNYFLSSCLRSSNQILIVTLIWDTLRPRQRSSASLFICALFILYSLKILLSL